MVLAVITVSIFIRIRMNFLVYAGMCNFYLGQDKEAIVHYDMAKTKHEQSHGDVQLLG